VIFTLRFFYLSNGENS